MKYKITSWAYSDFRMIKIVFSMLGVMYLMTANAEEPEGIIGRTYENGAPVIFKFVNELPAEPIRSQLSWLTVISWPYDGSTNNGMPMADVNQNMIRLEDTIEDNIENDAVLRHAYSRTGNNLKEFVYYIHDQAEFLDALNKTLSEHPRYPIEITFYQDQNWEDFAKLLSDFASE